MFQLVAKKILVTGPALVTILGDPTAAVPSMAARLRTAGKEPSSGIGAAALRLGEGRTRSSRREVTPYSRYSFFSRYDLSIL